MQNAELKNSLCGSLHVPLLFSFIVNEKLQRAPVVLLNPAVMSAVTKINHQPDNQPDNQSRPIDPAEFVHHVTVENNPKYRNQRNPRRTKWTQLHRIRFAQNNDRYANDDEREDRADVDHLSDDVNRSNTANHRRDDAHQNRILVRSAILRMNRGEEFPRQ